MMHGADAAEQMVRLSLEGMEVVLRVSGTGTKNLAVFLAATIREEKQILGETSLTSLIKSGRELTVFSIPEQDLDIFKREARRYGVLYSDIKDRSNSDEPVIDIITRAEDAPKINRIIERYQLAPYLENGLIDFIAEIAKGNTEPLRVELCNNSLKSVVLFFLCMLSG